MLAASSGPGLNISNNQGKLLSFHTVCLIIYVCSVVFVHVRKLIVLTFCDNNNQIQLLANVNLKSTPQLVELVEDSKVVYNFSSFYYVFKTISV